MQEDNITADSDEVAEFHATVSYAWSQETTAYENWSPSLGEAGQCAVTALLVQDAYGGTLRRALVNGESHYWNYIPGLGHVDLTRKQFTAPVTIEGEMERERDYLLSNPATVQRYEILREAVLNLS